MIASSTAADVDASVTDAEAALVACAALTPRRRAGLLSALASALDAEVAELVGLADRESGLGVPRLTGELARTSYQLRAFAQDLEKHGSGTLVDDAPVSGPPPAGHPRLTRIRVPVGPVAVFAASNFPFAFSVLGGDTASALAAGCPVVVKGHPGHPELSLRVWRLAGRVLAEVGLPAGALGYVHGPGTEVGVRLVQAPGIAAVAFTGSFRGGSALARVAADRPRPIPFYGELGSVNPVVVLAPALAAGEKLAQTLADSMCLGTGQFCTSPGVVVVPTGVEGDAFVRSLASALGRAGTHPMLTSTIRDAFERRVERWRRHPALTSLLPGGAPGDSTPRPFLAEATTADFVADPDLHEEVFGPAALVVRAGSTHEAVAALHAVGGSLTVTVLGAETGGDEDRQLVRAATAVAGRVLFDGVPTGVAVTAAQHHGGPFPASTEPFTTSVGLAARDRFLRPVALQSAPGWLLNGVLDAAQADVWESR